MEAGILNTFEENYPDRAIDKSNAVQIAKINRDFDGGITYRFDILDQESNPIWFSAQLFKVSNGIAGILIKNSLTIEKMVRLILSRMSSQTNANEVYKTICYLSHGVVTAYSDPLIPLSSAISKEDLELISKEISGSSVFDSKYELKIENGKAWLPGHRTPIQNKTVL